MNAKTIQRQRKRVASDAAAKRVELDEPALDEPEDCAATAWNAGKVRSCVKPYGHDGKHKAGRFEWRPRSGDVRL